MSVPASHRILRQFIYYPQKKKGISAARKVIQPEGGNKNHEHRSVQPSVRFRNYGLNNIVMMYVLKDNSDEDRICLTF